MACHSSQTPKPLVYCNGGGSVVEDYIVSVSTHPSQDLLAVGDVAGKLSLYSFKADEECCKIISSSPQHGHSCRILCFSKDGQWIFSGSSQKGVLFCTDAETGSVVRTVNTNCAPLYSLLQLSDKLLATGDEEGEIKLWDLKNQKGVCSLRVNDDFISDMIVDGENSTLLATSGDGSLTVMDLRQRKLEQRSETNESELLSLTIVKNGSKVVCGDGEGTLMIYNWGLWSDITDRYPIHPQAIDCLLALNASTICTGCMDGWVRSVQILPNQLLGSVGQHPGGFPVDNMCLSHDGTYVVTSSQDSCHFWSASHIPTLPPTESEEGGVTKKRKRKRKQKHRDITTQELVRTKKSQQVDFFADLCNN